MNDPKDYFRFKGFMLLNKDAAFRINTDGVLLASWIQLQKSDNKIIDIGTGTGLISCILNYRFDDRCYVGVDSDYKSCAEAEFNFKLNDLKTSQVIHSDIQSYSTNNVGTFDHCVSNPPFFTNSSLPDSSSKVNSKHNAGLSLFQLANACHSLLTSIGSISLILPLEESDVFENHISKYSFSLKSELLVKAREFKAPIRRLMHFQRNYSGQAESETIVMFTDKNRNRSIAYENLVGELYL